MAETQGADRPIAVRSATESDRRTAMSFISNTTARGRASLALLRVGQGLLWVAVEAAGEGHAEEQVVGLLLALAQVEPEQEGLAGYVQELLVHPAYRRRGVAMQLLDVAERFFLDEQGFALISLSTSPENEAALHLYRSRNYSVQQVRLVLRRPPRAGGRVSPSQ